MEKKHFFTQFFSFFGAKEDLQTLKTIVPYATRRTLSIEDKRKEEKEILLKFYISDTL